MTEKHCVLADPSFMRCVLEKEFVNSPNWKLVHNSSKNSDGDSRMLHIRVYQLVLFGRETDIGFKFVYDYKRKKARCDFDIVGEKALKHMKAGDYSPEKIQEYIVKKDTEKAYN